MEVERDRDERLGTLRQRKSEYEHRLSELKGDIRKVRHEISELETRQTALVLESASIERERVQWALEGKRQELKRLLDEYAHWEKNIRILQQEERKVERGYARRVQELKEEQEADEERIRRNYEARVRKLTQHIHQISQDQAQLQDFIKRAQAAVRRESSTSITMEVVPYEVELIEFKVKVLDVLASGINARVEDLLKVWEETALLLEQHTVPEADFGGACRELRVPIWLMRCPGPPVWRLAVGPCSIRVRKARPWRHSGIRVDKGSYKVIWDYIKRECQPFFEEISDGLESHSIISTDKQRAQLLAKMEKMQQEGYLSASLLAEVRRHLEA
jgi:hypothetical protein